MIRRIALVVLTAFGIACSHRAPPPAPSEPEPVASVRVAPLRRQSIAEDLTLYGTVVSGLAGSQTLSVPYECRVVHIVVRPGQQIESGIACLEVEPSPATRLAIDQAQAQSNSTRETLQTVRQSFANHLATNQELEQAEQASRQAELQLQSLLRAGSSRSRVLPSPGPAVVSAVHTTEGAIVPAGTPLMDFDFRSHREGRFGVEVEDVARIESAGTMMISDLSLPPAVTVPAAIRALSNTVDDQTRLVNLFAALPSDSPFILGQRVSGTVHISGPPTLVVPRAALLPVEDHFVVFTVRDSHAVAHQVRVGSETSEQVEIVGSDLAENDPVVIGGVPVLEDGMRVRIEVHP